MISNLIADVFLNELKKAKAQATKDMKREGVLILEDENTPTFALEHITIKPALCSK